MVVDPARHLAIARTQMRSQHAFARCTAGIPWQWSADNSAPVMYRIAFGPRAGQKILTLRGAMPREATPRQLLCGDIDGNGAARGRSC